MIDPPRIMQTAAQRIAVVRLRIPREEIRAAMGPGLAELRSTLKAQGVAPAGPWLTHHFRMAPAIFDFEIALPVATPIVPAGRVMNAELPAATVARTVYHGAYEALGAAWPELDRWIAAQGRTAGPSLWETYLSGPDENPDPASFRTELTRPLASSAE